MRLLRAALVLALLYVAARLLWALCEFWALFWLLMFIALGQGG